MMRAYAETDRCRTRVHARLLRRRGRRPLRDLRQLHVRRRARGGGTPTRRTSSRAACATTSSAPGPSPTSRTTGSRCCSRTSGYRTLSLELVEEHGLLERGVTSASRWVLIRMTHHEASLPDYDSLATGSIESRVRTLDLEGVRQLLAYEQAHAARPQIVMMLEHRLASLESGAAEPSAGDPAAPAPETAAGGAPGRLGHRGSAGQPALAGRPDQPGPAARLRRDRRRPRHRAVAEPAAGSFSCRR